MRQLSRITVIRALSALFVLLILAFLILYRDDIFQARLDPGEPFQTYAKPPAPDYALADSWMMRPDINQDPFDHPAPGDIFVVSPGLYKGGEHWNLPTDVPRRREKLNHVIMPNYVAPYKIAGRVFAPYYRQAALYTFMTAREDARRAQNLAYQDVKRAFEEFIRHSPPERPIVLVGHDQGASHVQRLLADFFQDDLSGRLAAAYVIGHPLPLDKFEGELSQTPPCETDIDTGCVIAFGAFMPNDRVIAQRFVTQRKVFEGRDYEQVENRPLLCTNPLLWNRSIDYAPRRLHKGGVAAIGLDPDMDPAPLVKQTGAQCQDGILYVDTPKSKILRRPIKFGGKFRTLPSNLFYEDLRSNALARVSALIESGNIPRRAEKLDDLEIIEIVDSPITPVDPNSKPPQ